ncbi:MAG TPA: hypothetical protein VKS82_00855 [Streptosporangiaceae bacterium]|nr:hypothetical protein [Streptosporangiaceae bacterium]
MSDPELAARAQRAAERLEQSWDRWRRLHGPAAEQAQPVASYVGYSLAEPWGRPRVVFGLGAEEAEQLAALLERDEGADPRFSQGLLWEPEPRVQNGNGATSIARSSASAADHAGPQAVPTPTGSAAPADIAASPESSGPAGTAGDFEPPNRDLPPGGDPNLPGWTRMGSPPPAHGVLRRWS